MTSPKNTSSTAVVLKTDRRGHVLTPPAERESILDAYEASGMSGARFCREHGLKYSTFAAWRSKRSKSEHAAGSVKDLPVDLVEVVVRDEPSTTIGEPICIELPGGARIRVSRSGQVALTAAVLNAIGDGSC